MEQSAAEQSKKKKNTAHVRSGEKSTIQKRLDVYCDTNPVRSNRRGRSEQLVWKLTLLFKPSSAIMRGAEYNKLYSTRKTKIANNLMSKKWLL